MGKSRSVSIITSHRDKRYSSLPIFKNCLTRVVVVKPRYKSARTSKSQKSTLSSSCLPITHLSSIQQINWILILDFSDLKERSMILRLNRNFRALNENTQVKSLSGEVSWNSTEKSMTSLLEYAQRQYVEKHSTSNDLECKFDSNFSIAFPFTKHTYVRLGWIRHWNNTCELRSHPVAGCIYLFYLSLCRSLPRLNACTLSDSASVMELMSSYSGVHLLEFKIEIKYDYQVSSVITQIANMKCLHLLEVIFPKRDAGYSIGLLTVDYSHSHYTKDISKLMVEVQSLTQLKTFKLNGGYSGFHKSSFDVSTIPPTVDSLSVSNLNLYCYFIAKDVDSITEFALFLDQLRGIKSLGIHNCIIPGFNFEEVPFSLLSSLLSLEECSLSGIELLPDKHVSVLKMLPALIDLLSSCKHLRTLDISHVLNTYVFHINSSYNSYHFHPQFKQLFLPSQSIYGQISPTSIRKVRSHLREGDIPFTITILPNAILISQF
ncbi:MAG: hypothetical protein Sylvanvirus10_13 [Sylvanvirus sp.]|uniref:Uncharacterized protein n=1 Tax=Sylvanvirus sp. TaxID=2487774 RepID=A0A3G5AI25_9VIRU|nr:MAG: hypothetical protein Sylvanvirus10_13 [Sylvanvirus sp.]